ncbi:ComEA family DNA-binding protein [Pseudomonas sp. NPDC087612]|uniref:Competence protein ComEA n=1 Tax=Pseudomonas vranovensis TaxID=321661 RepID=A0A423D4M3_9PSED|nr:MULTISPECIES: helix-hairpin-helix domain-containing protein [Pseudomonas]KJK19526.1 competence protein ComEA [Pseudomonas sp. 2(2015)]QPG63118.1 helix-hairpin-helix domain-containing protein [Pseudomonas sp. BIGb0427]QVM98110.1 helix-hairpin-helix domain-containing protein [Pseudomonas sp. SORT22]ROL66515.1 competence protein ComEA [Pseudomonas vranovensis]UVL55005.1 helix-hairpin-helix domain-containing protein [Pseudomonas sp. B21-035]
MRNTVLSYLFLPLFTAVSLSAMAAQPQVEPTAAMVTLPVAKLDLNQADATTLQTTLTGIGKTKAEAIVAYRDEHGAFTSVDELLEIKGIGKALLDRNRDKLTVN